MHIGKALYYGSYKSPRILPFAIGVIIFILMMANHGNWPNCEYIFNEEAMPTTTGIISNMLPFNKARTKAILRVGPHNKEILDLIICGMLGDFWGDLIKGKSINSVRFQIEQSIKNSAYIHYLSLYFYKKGYCARPVPILNHKNDTEIENRLNYRLTLFSYTSLTWIYDSFYIKLNNKTIKRVPDYISEYLTPMGLAHWIMQDGSHQKGQGINIATNCFTFEECEFLAFILANKYNLKTSVIKSGFPNQWRISIWKRSMPELLEIVGPYFIPEMEYKIKG